ncbi:hypothetical protein [Haloarcula laminariae]|uniref:hypothetical protein n=1 Tax=Haloarcula laminariae TaxID=2961577 RepID=UPI002405EAFD|nr:hypothetical protein [Halomicroarcula sp. FL173]
MYDEITVPPWATPGVCWFVSDTCRTVDGSVTVQEVLSCRLRFFPLTETTALTGPVSVLVTVALYCPADCSVSVTVVAFPLGNVTLAVTVAPERPPFDPTRVAVIGVSEPLTYCEPPVTTFSVVDVLAVTSAW